jgi:hypothetical protein
MNYDHRAIQIARCYVRQQLVHQLDEQDLLFVRLYVRVEVQGVDHVIPIHPLLEEMGAEIVREFNGRGGSKEAGRCTKRLPLDLEPYLHKPGCAN